MAWPQDAYVGQRVVCVDASPSYRGEICLLVLNAVYIIKAIEVEYDKVAFVIDPMPDTQYWFGYKPSRFRPVQSTDKGMSILTEILNNAPTFKVLEKV